ncbi:MAG: hypothetical protein PHF86_06875 [Candidatus Nanoarchaeia archaeon]|nr:hypothetical protein [Candidatus Nanoarchaeia archaeon]
MSIKNIILVVFAVLLLTSTVKAASDINIDLVSYQPTTLVPGTYFNAVFEVENTDSENVTDIDFKLTTDSSLSIESDSKKTFSVLEPNKPIQLNYKIRVNTDASTGYKDLILSYDNSDSDSEKFSVFINSIETNLVLNDIKQDDLIPGNKGKLTINFQNKANYNLKDVKVILDLSLVPFAPIDSSSEKIISVMTNYGSSSMDFNLIALPDAEAGVYKIPIKIIYFDEFGRMYNKSDLISLTISAYPYLDVSIDKNVLVQNTKSTVSVKFVNRGLTSIKFLNAKLMESQSYNILSSDNFYIGDINVDDYQTIDFDLMTKKSGNVVLPLMISYKDANNKDYVSTVNLNTKVYTVSEAKQIGLVPAGSNLIIIIPILLIIIFVIYKIYKRRK